MVGNPPRKMGKHNRKTFCSHTRNRHSLVERKALCSCHAGVSHQNLFARTTTLYSKIQPSHYRERNSFLFSSAHAQTPPKIIGTNGGFGLAHVQISRVRIQPILG